jgi:hypothetical protein
MNADNDNQSERWPPKRCEMPDLSNMSDKLTISYFMNQTFGRTGLQLDGPGGYQFLVLIRLVDKTLLEYEQAREYLQRYVDSNNKTSQFMRCVGHMENCVDSLHRCFLHMEGLRVSLHKERERESDPLPHIGREEVPKKSSRDRVMRIRHAIQHMDERISKGRAGADIAPIGLNVKSDSIELDHEEIYFAELASWIRQVYKVAERLITYDPLASSSGAGHTKEPHG